MVVSCHAALNQYRIICAQSLLRRCIFVMLLARSSVHERALVSTHFPFNKNDACFDRIVTTVRLLLEPHKSRVQQK